MCCECYRLKGDGSDDCLDRSAEIAFVVDRSSSMGGLVGVYPHTSIIWSHVKVWLEALVDAYKIDGITRKGGLVAWSSNCSICNPPTTTCILESATVRFTDDKTAEELKTVIVDLPHPEGSTDGGCALDYTYTNLFAVGSDPSVFREIIFITDGKSETPIEEPATQFHDNNIRVTVVAFQFQGNYETEELNKTLCVPCGDRFFINEDIDELSSDEFL